MFILRCIRSIMLCKVCPKSGGVTNWVTKAGVSVGQVVQSINRPFAIMVHVTYPPLNVILGTL